MSPAGVSTCPTSWSDMAGGERARVCSTCQLIVYELVGLDEAGARRLLELDGRPCRALYRRPDGRVMKRACPVPAAPDLLATVLAWVLRAAFVMLVGALLLWLLGFIAFGVMFASPCGFLSDLAGHTCILPDGTLWQGR